MTFEEWFYKHANIETTDDPELNVMLAARAAWHKGGMKFRKSIVKYRKALLEIANSECINAEEYALEVLKDEF